MELSSRLQRLMFVRVLIVSVLLGASVFVQVRKTSTYFGDIQTTHYVLIGCVYFLTFVYIVLLKRLRNLNRLAYAQLLIDTLLITAFIYTTGGIESFFSFLYILTIIEASMLLYRRGGLIVASSSSILYGALLDLHYYRLITPYGALMNPPGDDQGAYILFRILVHTAAFYLVAMLSSYLSEQIRTSRDELEATKVDINKLEVLNERIVQSIASGLITVDGGGRVILFNPAAESVFGITAEEANGRPLTELLPFLVDYLDPEASLSGSRKTPAITDIPFRNHKGEELFLRLTVSPLSMPGGEAIGRILVFQDLTEIKRIEQEMQRVEGLAMVGELAAGIAHEIRNPMASISGSIQVLKEGLELREDDVTGRLMEIVMREVNRLNHLVNDFLLYARPRKTKTRRFELNSLIRDSLELFLNTGDKSDRIRVVSRLGDPLYMDSDPEQLKQVLWNILRNAQEAMPEGGTIHIETRLEDGAGRPADSASMAELIVQDTGTGFSESALENLFTPFHTTKEEGSGLGLATVKRIVEGLRGRVQGGNHPEQGARVTLHLPLAASDPEAP
ncbi:MAG: PAS domain S-box protein [Deltaproteobacteria bacterium]|nr:PAS domain S-box protein [Deltaproteobacteria bacterium]